jgi:hypothetical protein
MNKIESLSEGIERKIDGKTHQLKKKLVAN